ncbi:2-polyprenyl-6-methoxyphenol hydroxylase [Streptomyces sp. Ag82_O1-12]|uniref:FAD-dependent monooxygenase n=1 Tax=unclassified Streptomyces TaxID=2593676 RepID=UPI000BD87F17|nr:MULTISPECIES: FAD-dependent monooxygenase [unclassified Streptomyces]SMQ20713.1 2-polyprenyl-6-methoxyphenol hydroxylase [Streptomyces sp. Ag82_O1-12]SOD49447.1 2-polyprenyl-6-methoxyphenol hydroxylase [Streptomyces sp. Ag82_G6-1]
MVDTDVLIVGAGPVGLTVAAELRRQGATCRIIDRLPARLPYAKAVGVQPRTLEVWDRMGMVRAALEAAVPMRGQLTYADGVEQARFELRLPPEVPYGFAALPQYDTERIIEEHLARFGTGIERGTELLGFTQDEDGVVSRIVTASGAPEEVRSRFLVGCDGAHSTVRKGLGLTFEGGAFPEEYMLADVEVDWNLPEGHAVRSMHHGADGRIDDALVCIPLPGERRYRMSMQVPPELSTKAENPAPGETAHGLEGGRAPRLEHIQAVVDRLSPEPATASAMRWSSVFRISHRLVDRYSVGRVFVAGDAAHIHPPTGAQGMNTGIQDACNLAWKLAIVLDGGAHPRLLDSYDAERRPVGEEVVGRTVRHATAGGVQTAKDDRTTVMLREAQLLVAYPDSPLTATNGAGPTDADRPGPGDRAPDCRGLTTSLAMTPLRLYDLLRDRGHVLVLHADSADALTACRDTAATADRLTGGTLPAFLVAAGDSDAGRAVHVPVGADGRRLPVFRDEAGEFARLYGVEGATAFLIRPDGYLAARLTGLAAAETEPALADALGRVFRL